MYATKNDSENGGSRVLVVCPYSRMREPAFAAASDLPASVVHAESCFAARACLSANDVPDLIVTAVTLRDGNWEGLHRVTVESGAYTVLVVAAPADSPRLQDELLLRGVVHLPLGLSPEECAQRLHEIWSRAVAGRLGRGHEAAVVEAPVRPV